jgi:hypothetical protein
MEFSGALAALEAAATAESVATAPAGCYTLSPGALVRNNTYNAAAGATAADAAAKEAAANADAGNADRCA